MPNSKQPARFAQQVPTAQLVAYRHSPSAVWLSLTTTALKALSIRQSVRSVPLLKTNKPALLVLLESIVTPLLTTHMTVRWQIATSLMGTFADLEPGRQNHS